MMEYQRRGGCNNVGVTYEYRMTALLSLRCALSKDVKEFWIASNASSVGDCDDIVLSIKSNAGDKIVFLIQLKTIETKKKLQEHQFTYSRTNKKDKEKEKFSIEKYWDSFVTLRKNLDNLNDQSDFIKELREADNIILILYTNGSVEESIKFLSQSDLSKNFFHLLGTNNVKHCHRFNQNELPSRMSSWGEFLQRFYLFSGQIHAEDVINVMETEIQNYFSLTAPWMINFQDAVNKYVEYVKTWIKGYKIGKDRKFYAIIKTDVLKTLVGIVLHKYKFNLSTKEFTFYEDTKKTIWNEIISDKDVTLLNNNKSIVQFLQSYYGNELLRFLQKNPTEWKTALTKKAQKSFYTTFGHAKVAQVSQNVKFSIVEIYNTLWMHGSVPLLLDLEDSNNFKDVLNILKVCDYSIKVIVLLADSALVNFGKHKLKCFVTFKDLNFNHQKELLGVEVNFQGRTSVPLNNLVDDTLYSIIKCHDVINILLNEFIVGSEFEKMFEYFIGRSMSRVLLRYEVLKLPNETFFVETKDTIVAQDMLKINVAKHSSVHFINSVEQLKQQKYKGRTLHRLVYHEGKLEWKESVGNIANLRKHVIPSHEHESYNLVLPENLQNLLTDNSINKTKILSAGPGMGKSIMMDFVALFAPKDVWVIKIQLSNRVLPEKPGENKKHVSKTESTPKYCDSDISDVSSDDDDETLDSTFDATKFFERLLTEDERIYARDISLAVFRKFYKANKILILLDGFDEISVDYKEKVTDMMQLFQKKKHAIWVTTRDHMKTHLEESLNVLASTLKLFTPDEQKTFLNNYFNANTTDVSNKPIVEEFAIRLLNAAAKNLSARDGEFTGVPLQTTLLANVFLKRCRESCQNNVIKFNERFDLLNLYDNFIKEKNEIFINKFRPEKKSVKKLKEVQKYYALCQVFMKSTASKCFETDVKLTTYDESVEKQFLQRGGILVVREKKRGLQIEFIHRTFAEYLAAKCLAEKFLSTNDVIRTNALFLIGERYHFPDDYQFLFLVFERILAKNNPLHLSIINIKADYLNLQIDENPNSLLECDDLNRNGLHMLALYGKEFPSNNLKKVLKKMKLFEISQLSAPDLFGYAALDYCFRFQNWIIADSICKAEPYLQLKSDYHEDLDDLKSEFVFRTLFHNFCVAALLRGEISENYPILQCGRDIAHERRISSNRFQFLYKLKAVTVCQYLELVGIKEINAARYFDARFAVALGTIDNVKNLLDSTNININQKDCNNATLLHYAIYNHRYNIFKELLTRGGDLDISDNDGNTSKHLLALNGAFELLDWADIITYKAKNQIRETPLDLAIQFNQYRAKKYCYQHFDQIHESEKVYYAAALGDNKLLLELLAKGCNINHLLDNEKTAFHAALEHNHIDTAILLIDHDIDLSLLNKIQSFLHKAAVIGNRLIFEKLLSKNMNINRRNVIRETPLIVAINHGHAELVEFIISKGADVSISPKYGTALTTAIVNLDNQEVITLILEKGCDINKTHRDMTPLTLALKFKKPNIASLLLKMNPKQDITVRDTKGATPLHYAAKNGYTNLVTSLLETGINADVQNNANETPLLLALRENNMQVAKILIHYNADVLLKDNNGYTPLHYAAAYEHCDLLAEILNKGGDVNKSNIDKATPLLWALMKGHDEAVSLMLKHRGDLKKEYVLGYSSLHLAAGIGNDKIVQKCLELKMNVNIENDFQETPLLVAVNENKLETALFLIDNEADVFLTDHQKDTLLHLASNNGQNDFIVQMLERNLDVNAINHLGETPLCRALIKNHFSTVELLLSRGAKRDTVCNDGQSILHLAACSNFDKLLLQCLDKNIFDVNIEDNQGKSSLECALEKKSLRCAKLLLERGAHVKSHHVYVLYTVYLKTIQITRKLAEEELSEEELTDEELTTEELAEEELTKEELNEKELIKKELTEEELIKKDLIRKKLSEKKLADEELTGEELTQEDLTKEELTEKELNKKELIKETLIKEELTKEELTEEELTEEELIEEELTEAYSVATKLVTLCSDINELDKNENSILINIFIDSLDSVEFKDINNLYLFWFCKISNLLLDSGADKETKGSRNRSATDIFEDTFEDTNAMSAEQRRICLDMGLVKRLRPGCTN